MFVKTLVALACLAASVVAQNNSTTIDPSVVSPQLRASWCNGQQNVCKILCSSATNANTCDPTSLNYTCLCASNNSSPDLAAYMTSMPYFICEESYDLCIQNNPNNQLGQDGCQNNIRANCGTLNIANFTAPASTATSSGTAPAATGSASTTAGGSSTGTAASTSASATASKSAAIAAFGKEHATGVLAAGLLAFFGLML